MPNVESQDDRDSEPNSEANPSEPDTEKEDDTEVASQESSSEKTPSVEIPHEKTPEPLSKKGKKQVYVASEEEDSDDQEVHKKVIASASKKATVSTSKNVVSVPEKKTKKDKKYEKIAASTGKKRKYVAETDSEPDVEPDVPDITTTVRPKFFSLMKTVKDIGRCFSQLVRKFIVNISTDCDDESSPEFRKVYVRGKCVNFSSEVVNEFLGRSLVAGTNEEPDLNRVAKTLTGKMIGCANWMATNHLSGVTPPLARMLYLIGTGGQFDFGKLGSASTSATQAGGASKDDILAELRAVSKSLDATIQACKITKRNVDKLIKAMTQVPAAGAEEGNIEESTENVEDDNAGVEEEEAQYENAGEDDDESNREIEESTVEEKEDVTGSTSSSPCSTFL
ncbi:uncharacterized protein LOC130725334 [Lotus japonicus]|uniref:uncharacterized protein LOC130725334 n=1 Tax=Lotus japonicus TaxID=34305 RepID=UPI002585EEF0|nr:uncharacterized protein LOC130725334 [Lotus japonicus]